MVDVAEGDVGDIDRVVFAARKAFDKVPWLRMTAYVKLHSTPISFYTSISIKLFYLVICNCMFSFTGKIMGCKPINKSDWNGVSRTKPAMVSATSMLMLNGNNTSKAKIQ